MTKQQERILNYMIDYGSITPMEAFADLGITKLATRVSEMIADGMIIKKERVTGKNRYGDNIHFTRYSLPDECEVR